MVMSEGAKPHQVLGFRTKAAALAACRDILHRNDGPLEGADLDLMLRVLALHRRHAIKIGVGVRGLYVASHPEYPNKCFWVERIDGTHIGFSFRQCFDPSDHRDEVLSALRHAVREDITAFRAAQPAGSTCCQCGSAGQLHVDHIEPFVGIAEAWLDGASWSDVRLTKDPNMMIADALDPDVLHCWQEWHRHEARLQLLCAACNLSKGAR